jgi:hypothetical protein
MQSQRTAASAGPRERNASGAQTPDALLPDRTPKPSGWLATPLIALVALVCCAGPLLLGAMAATGAGAWLAAHGYSLGAAAFVLLAAVLAWRIRARISQG